MPWQTIVGALGGSEGRPLERLAKGLRAALGLSGRSGVDRAAFTAAVVALSAKLSKADGVSLKIEMDAFERMFSVEEGEAANVRWLFEIAAQDVAGFESYARELAAILVDKPDLKGDIFEALLHVASADGVMHDGESRYLKIVSDIFGFTDAQYRAFRARFVDDATDPYQILGASHDMTDEELKRHYRALVRLEHPDALAGKGASAQLQGIAQRRLAAINAAWDEIARERGL